MSKYFLVILLSLGIHLLYAQQGIPPRPDPPRLVNDFSDILRPDEEQYLESKLVALDDSTGMQVVVVTVDDLGDYDKAEFTYTLGEQWGVGGRKFDNGVVVMVKPRGAEGDRHAFIATGYGMEGILPDATAFEIVNREMIPSFRNGNFFQGIDRATDVISELARQEYPPSAYGRKPKAKATGIPVGMIVLILIILFSIFSRGRRRHNIIGHGVPWWMWLLLGSQTGKKHKGNWKDFSSGRGGFGGWGGGFGGGGGGGGFGGFGGGSFGGGGAGGSW